MRYQNQRGQSMVFGLLFMGIAVIALILIFNQGILTRDRVQLENAADAAVYSQAKLFARHQNLIAYTNRAMIANELSIGTVVGLMSWAKRYTSIPSFVNTFPAYQVPILLIPPKPSIADVLNTVTLPYQIIGSGVQIASGAIMTIYPGVVSSFNTIMGFFQKAFALATIEAQFRIPVAVVAQHRMERPEGSAEDNLEVAPLSNLFLVQNFILTYFADYIPIDMLLEQISGAQADDPGAGAGANPPPVVDANNDPEEPSNMLADFLGGYTPGSMLVNMSTAMHAKTPPGAKDSLERRQSSRYYAAVLNDQRGKWLNDRSFDPSFNHPLAGFTLSTPTIKLPLGFINISFSFKLGVGVHNNGGTAYIYNPLSVSAAGKQVPVFGWRSIDFSSIGFSLEVALAIEICIPKVACTDVFSGQIKFGLGLPLGGATHQFVTNAGDEFLFAPQWGTPAQAMLGGKSVPYGKAMDPVHIVTYGWGMVPPQFIYGARRNLDVNFDASGSPSFFTLGSDHAETGRSKEFTVAVSKPHSSVRTSDNPDSLNLQNQDGNVDNRERQIVRPDMFALQTQEVRAEDNPLLFLWGDGERMMTISSAETYFAPPPGREESPNQYSPFWDARLREPSKVVQFIASGQIDIREVLGLNNLSAAGVAGFLLGLANDNLLEPGLDIALDKLPPMIKPIAGPIIKEVAGSVLDRVTEGVVGALE